MEKLEALFALTVVAAVVVLVAAHDQARTQQKSEIAISRAFDFIYMVTHVNERNRPIEKRADR